MVPHIKKSIKKMVVIKIKMKIKYLNTRKMRCLGSISDENIEEEPSTLTNDW